MFRNAKADVALLWVFPVADGKYLAVDFPHIRLLPLHDIVGLWQGLAKGVELAVLHGCSRILCVAANALRSAQGV